MTYHWCFCSRFISFCQGAFWALMLAFLTGVIRMILAFVYYDNGGCGKSDNRPAILKNFHYMYFSLFITLLTGATAIIISLFTEKPHQRHVCTALVCLCNYKRMELFRFIFVELLQALPKHCTKLRTYTSNYLLIFMKLLLVLPNTLYTFM